MAIKNVRIQECAEVRPGFSAKSAIVHDPGGTLQVIAAQHVKKGEPYRYEENHKLLIEPPKFYEKYLVVAGDILFMSRGINNYAILIESVPNPTIAPLTFFIIRAKQDVLPEYLAWCLNQDVVAAKLNEFRAGDSTPMIKSSDFKDISIPIPPLAMQQKIAVLGRLQSREKRLLQQLAVETDSIHKTISKQILSNLIHIKE